jgi:hypothetical protein
MAAFAEFCMVAVKPWFVPISSESEGAGAIVMLAGTGKLVVVTALPLLQPVRLASSRTAMLHQTPKMEPSDLPMHPLCARDRFRNAITPYGNFPV